MEKGDGDPVSQSNPPSVSTARADPFSAGGLNQENRSSGLCPPLFFLLLASCLLPLGSQVLLFQRIDDVFVFKF